MAEGPDLYPRDLLRRLGRSGESPVVVEEPVEVELSLGLSLGGDYGKGLVRSSSISAISNFVEEEEKGLVRTCSLPAGSGEQIRKRKELQCLRRMEAKRKRCEKRCLRLEQLKGGDNGIVGLVPSRSEVRMNCVGGGGQGGCSTTSSDYDCRPMEGLDISGLRRSNSDAAKINSSIKLTAKPTEDSISCALKKDASDPLNLASKGLSEVASSMMAEMPSVSAKGDGPNGRRIEGFLYKYNKCEDVRIVCVCHGSFLSPAEFVKHAGGSDVEFPLRHIVVHPCP